MRVVEVELAPKSKQRLDAILRLHRDWLWDQKTNGIVYISGGPAFTRSRASVALVALRGRDRQSDHECRSGD